MNKLTPEKRAQLLHMLCEGNSIRAVERMSGCSKHTITKLLVDAGKACMAYHDQHVRDVKTSRIQVDEIWSFTYAKQKNVARAKAAPVQAGDTWTWTALDADSKLIVSYFVGGRDSARVQIPVEFSYDGLGAAAGSIMRRGTVTYRATGTVDVRTPLGTHEVPFRKRGTVTLMGTR